MMPIDNIPDWEQRIKRQDAFWYCQIIDRPVANIIAPNPEYVPKVSSEKTYSSIRERWMDPEVAVEAAKARVAEIFCMGDALPHVFPNLGPEILSAFMGCELEFSETTSWAIPNITDWKDTSRVKFSEDSVYWKKINEITDALLDAGKGIFYTGVTDFHPGADAVAAFRDPLSLNIDMIEAKEQVLQMLEEVAKVYFQTFDYFYNKLTAAGQPMCSWPGIVSNKKWYVPSNDFSCMVSKEMFDEVFLPGIIEECRYLETSIYHLDGPGALRHLDSLLEIPELNAVQWIYGAGNGTSVDWIPVYKKCQAAGKGIQLWVLADEVDTLISELRPEGVWLGVYVVDVDQGEAVLKKVEKWT